MKTKRGSVRALWQRLKGNLMVSPPSYASYPNYPAQAPGHHHAVGVFHGGYGGPGPVGPGVLSGNIDAPVALPSRWSEANLYTMIAVRLGWNVGTPCSFLRIVPVRVTEEEVVTFVVVGKKALLIPDDANLFPSDALVTQLRILGETV